MKVLVIGATGQTGRHVVRILVHQGHDVTAFVRQSSETMMHDRVRVAVGDALDADSLEHAVENQDAVVAAFGPRTYAKTDLQEVFMRNLVLAMKKKGVKRLVNLSAWGAGGRAVPPRNLFARFFFIPVVLRHLRADKRRGEAHLFGSDLEYANVCPAFLKNAPARGAVRASLDGEGLEQVMHREDLAAFMVQQLTSQEWLRKCVVIGY